MPCHLMRVKQEGAFTSVDGCRCSGLLAHLCGMGTDNGQREVLEPVLSLSELAARLRVSVQTLYDLRSQGRAAPAASASPSTYAGSGSLRRPGPVPRDLDGRLGRSPWQARGCWTGSALLPAALSPASRPPGCEPLPACRASRRAASPILSGRGPGSGGVLQEGRLDGVEGHAYRPGDDCVVAELGSGEPWRRLGEGG